QQSATQAASPPAPTATADKLSSSLQLAANNRMAEPPGPAEGPSETSQAPISAELPAEKNESPPGDLPDRTVVAAKDFPRTTTPGIHRPKAREQVASPRGGDNQSESKPKARRQRNVNSFPARPLP